MILGNKFYLVVLKSHLTVLLVIFKFPKSNALLCKMTELQGINVTVPSGYLYDIILLDCQEVNHRKLLRQKPNEHTHTQHPPREREKGEKERKRGRKEKKEGVEGERETNKHRF